MIYLLKMLLFISIITSYDIIAQMPTNNINFFARKYRIVQLENIFNIHSQMIIQLYQQLYDTQKDINLLRGQIQENKHYILILDEKQKQINKKITNISSKILTTLNLNKKNKNINYNQLMTIFLNKKKRNDNIQQYFRYISEKYPSHISK